MLRLAGSSRRRTPGRTIEILLAHSEGEKQIPHPAKARRFGMTEKRKSKEARTYQLSAPDGVGR